VKHFVLAAIACALSQCGQAQEAPTAPEKYNAHNKGKFFAMFGGNRDYYTTSDIHFTGKDYDFTLYDVKAHDKPKGIHIDYFNPARMTIPQTNMKFGYFFTDHYSISLGVDHMKYIMTQNQTADMSGHIEGHAPFNGTYDHEPQVLTTDFLKFEHTNGLNLVFAEIARQDDFSRLIGSDIDKFQLNTSVGFSAGGLYPRTDATLMGERRNNEFHVAGYGVALKAGLNLNIFKHFFIQWEAKGGYINMPDIRTTPDKSDKASQHFCFIQNIFAIGTIWKL